MSKKEEIPNSVIDLPVYHGVLQEKKCTPKADSEDSYYHYVIGFIGFTITHEVKADKFNDFKVGDLLKVLVSPVAKASDNYSYFSPQIMGIKAADSLESILKIPTGRISVLNSQVFNMKDSKDLTKTISYSKVTLSGALSGEFTGNKDFAVGLEKMSTYDCLMTIGVKKGVVQFLPSSFMKVEGAEIDF